jgi:uncharacterized DUF497 family protein
MMKLKFEWHNAKAEANWRAHGVRCELATTVFKDPFAVEFVDDRKDYGETRFIILGMAGGAGAAVCGLRGTRGSHPPDFCTESDAI